MCTRQFRVAVILDHLGDAEVQNLELNLSTLVLLLVNQHQVRGLQVAVDDRLGLARCFVFVTVCILEHRAELVDDLNDHLEREWLARVFLEHLIQAATAHELHLDVAHRAGASEVIDGHGVGVIELGHQSGFALKPGPALVVLGDLGLDQLERAGTVQLDVVHLPDLTHAPFADPFQKTIFVEDDPVHFEDRHRQHVPLGGAAVGLGC